MWRGFPDAFCPEPPHGEAGARQGRRKAMLQNKISVIVPVYNAQDYLRRCVESIRAQTFQNLEILLVDDGATDESPQMCDAYARKDERIRVIHKENGGLMSAWTAGVREAAGDWLLFVDSDDWIDACMVEGLAREAQGEPGEVVCCNFAIERPDGAQVCRHELEPGIYEGERLLAVKERLLGNERRTVSMSRCMKLFSAELIRDNLRFCDARIRMGEDVNIVLPALCDCSRLVILKDAAWYHYFYNPASMVHKYDPSMTDGIRALNEAIHRVLTEKGIPNGQEQGEKEAVYLSLLAVKNELRGGRSGYAERIRKISREGRIPEKLKRYLMHPADKANRILAWVARKPDRLRCAAGAALFGLYDRRMG